MLNTTHTLAAQQAVLVTGLKKKNNRWSHRVAAAAAAEEHPNVTAEDEMVMK